MSIRVICPGCRQTLIAPDDATGRQVRCKQCGFLMVLPIATAILVQPPPLPPPVQPERQATFSLEDSEEDIIERPEPRRRRRQYADSFDAGTRSASFGIAALVVSVVAFLVCWLPGVGMCIAGLGIILAIGSFGRRESAGFAIAGLFMSLMASLPSIFVFIALNSRPNPTVAPAALPLPANNADLAPQPQPTRERPRPVDNVRRDSELPTLASFVAMFPADGFDSTEFDKPRPPIVTKWAIYKREGVKVGAIVEAAEWGLGPENGAIPNDRFRIVYFSDLATGHVIEPKDGAARIAGRKR